MTFEKSPPQDLGASALEPPSKAVLLNPADPLDRQVLFAAHPVITRGFKIPTPPIKSIFLTMSDIIASGAPGCAFVGLPRFGKTYASEYCKYMLANAFPNIPIIRFHAHSPDRGRLTRASFYRDLLQQTLLIDVPLNSKKDIAQQLARAWWMLAKARESRTIVLMGDEMQKLTPDAYSWLIDITNDLHEMDVRSISILFAQPELHALRAVLRRTRRTDILGRFMARVFSFEGISSAGDLRAVMEAYDDPDELEYPEYSGWSFTQFFLPKAYATGWRLASHAGECWELFKLLAIEQLRSPDRVQSLSVGMEWIAGAMQYILVQSCDADRDNFRVTRERWIDAIRSTGWADALAVIYPPEEVERL